MAIILQKGQRINLKKETGDELKEFCVGCNWGAVTKSGFLGSGTVTVDVDLDLSCLMFDANGNYCDYVYSNLYRFADSYPELGLPNGKLDSVDRAIHHTGDDLTGDQDGDDDGRDNEIITVDLKRVNDSIHQIVFFLNIYNNEEFTGDFSEIPYASIRMYEGTPSKVRSVFAQYDVATKVECAGKRGLIMGKLYKRNGEWKFAAIGDAFEDRSIVETIRRIIEDYSK